MDVPVAGDGAGDALGQALPTPEGAALPNTEGTAPGSTQTYRPQQAQPYRRKPQSLPQEAFTTKGDVTAAESMDLPKEAADVLIQLKRLDASVVAR